MADGDGLVQVAYLHGDHSDRVSHSWHQSMTKMMVHDLMTDQRIMGTAGPIELHTDAMGVAGARNDVVAGFLDQTPYEWLWFIDTDMGFDPDTVDRLLEAADPATRPVVGALCFGLRFVRTDGMGGYRALPVPTLFQVARKPNGQVGMGTRWDFPHDGLVQVAGTGAACLLIHRTALEKVRAEYGDHWFDRVRYDDGDLISEDLSFCARLANAKIPVHVHTGIKTTHHKAVWVGADDYTPPPIQNVSHLPAHIEVEASLATLARNDHVHDGMLKLPADLDRYAQIIQATKPEVIVETGTRTGASAEWFTRSGFLDVITVDVTPPPAPLRGNQITVVTGDSADPAVAAKVRELVAGRRCMVSLDSDHSAAHVAAEIGLYGPLVSPGCYLVVEDGIFGYAPPDLRAQHGLADMHGSPLDAIAEHMDGNPDWSRDVAIERAHPTSHHPAGFWVRHG